MIEDLHWMDGASEDLIRDIIESPRRFILLFLLSQRTEYRLQWVAAPHITRLALEPLPAGLVRRLMGARLGVTELPDALARAMTERADGNALFAEEIVSYLSERGAVKADAGKVKYDAVALSTALPLSLQSLLAARVGRLSPNHRTVLQAASVIGRRFEPGLLAATVGSASEVEAALSDAVALDLAYGTDSTRDFEFKHALVRDALYQSLLSEPRQALHLKIAEELEQRSDNRLNEAAAALALHYGQTTKRNKAFVLSGDVDRQSIAGLFIRRGGTLVRRGLLVARREPKLRQRPSGRGRPRRLRAVSQRILPTEDERSDHRTFSPSHRSRGRLPIRNRHSPPLRFGSRLRGAIRSSAGCAGQSECVGRAHRRHSVRGLCARKRSIPFDGIAPGAADTGAKKAAQAIPAVSEVDDPYLQYFVRFAIGAAEVFRGHPDKAANIADDLLKVYALSALSRAECLAQVLEFRAEAQANGWGQFMDMSDGPYAAALLANGRIGAGIHCLEDAVVRQTGAGMSGPVNVSRMILADVYVRVVSGAEKPSFRVVVRNLPALLRARRVSPSGASAP